MAKNPISALQEFLQKNCQPLPKYDITSTSVNSFTYRVACEVRGRNFSATGESRNKQAAKFLAAENLITILKSNSYIVNYSQIEEDKCESPCKSLPSSASGSPTSVYSSNSSSPDGINAIGMLQETCAKYNYVLPSYSEGSYTHGHSNFRMTCTLGTYQVDGISNGKKKQAKYACAKKMLEDLKQMTEKQKIHYKIICNTQVIPKTGNIKQNDSKPCTSKELSIDSPSKTSHVIKQALSLFPKLSKSQTLTSDTTKIKLSLYHTYFKNSLDNTQLKNFFEFYQKLNLKQIENDIDELSSVLDKICTILNIEKKESTIKTTDGQNYAVVIKLTTNPEILDVGTADNPFEAKLNVYYRIIRTIFYILI